MLKVLYAPLEAIAEAKKERSMKKTMLVLLVASVISLFNVFLTLQDLSLYSLKIYVLVFLGTFLASLFLAFLFKLSMGILSKKSGYYEALTTITYGTLIISCGYILSTIVSYIPINLIQTALSLLILIFSFILAYSVMLRAGMELFQSDLFTVLVSLGIIGFAILMGAYMVMLKLLMGSGLGGLFGLNGLGSLGGASGLY